MEDFAIAPTYVKSDSNRDSQDIAVEKAFGRIWVPLSVRCHFWRYDESLSDGEQLADLIVSVKPGLNLDEFQTRIFDAHRFGVYHDLNLVWPASELGFLSGWTYGKTDSIVINWTNPGNIAWALSFVVGLYRG